MLCAPGPTKTDWRAQPAQQQATGFGGAGRGGVGGGAGRGSWVALEVGTEPLNEPPTEPLTPEDIAQLQAVFQVGDENQTCWG